MLRFPFRNEYFDFIGEASESLKNEVFNNQLFKNWIKSLDPSLSLKSVELQTFVRDENGKMKYIKLSTITERNGGKIPRIIVLQGFVITALIILESLETNIKYAVLHHKILIATGKYQYVLPFEVTGTNVPDQRMAATFIKRETTLCPDENDIIDLPQAATGNKIGHIYPYPGPFDECNKIFLYEKKMHDDEIKEIDGKEIYPNVHITVLPIDDVDSYIRDFVSLAPFMYYSKLKGVF